MIYLNKVAGALMDRGFLPRVCDNREEAKALLLEDIGDASVGIGGSVTIDLIKIYDELEKRGNTVYWHWKSKEENIREKACGADVYLASANALLEDGRFMNIDGTGNRVSALIQGPKKAIVVVGRNKIVSGGLDDALQRIRDKACGPNALRLGLNTPCALTGKCTDCRSAQRICSVITVTEKPTLAIPEYLVYLIDEDLGF